MGDRIDSGLLLREQHDRLDSVHSIESVCPGPSEEFYNRAGQNFKIGGSKTIG